VGEDEMYHVLTIELSKKLPKRRWQILKGLNPKRKKGTSVTQCLILRNKGTINKCKNGDFSWTKSGWTKLGTGIIPEFSKSFEDKIQAYKWREESVRNMRELGWRVYFENPRNRRVYIIELEQKAWDFKGFEEENGGVLSDWKKLLYVGETKESVIERFKIHKQKINGKKNRLASKIVFEHGKGIAKKLMKDFENKMFTESESLEKEREVGLYLREMGYATWFN